MAKQVSAQGLEWFLKAKFGMFIHWGVYAIPADGEWVMYQQHIPVEEYEKLPPQFNPQKFNADEWVSIAADAGQKYMVITSRHHDGFSMYDTALSDYKVTNTPFKRDPLQELADACARRTDIKLGFYSSLLDWHHPAYRLRQESGLAWSDYVAFLHGQVHELCTNFGEIACLWFDGDWPRHPFAADQAHFLPGGSFEYEKLYDMIHTLQPNALIHNNHHVAPLPGEDYQGFEQDLPGENTAGFNISAVYDLPVEVCMTINGTWGYRAGDENHKSTRRLVNLLTRCAAVGANYLLNVGPTPEDEILPIHAHRLRMIGEWLTVNGEAIYGAEAGTIVPARGSVTTHRGAVHYLHLLDDISDVVEVQGLPESISQATLLTDNAPVKLQRHADRVALTIPSERRDPLSTVIRLA